MNLAEAIVTVVGSFFVLLGTVVTVRGKRGGPPPVTNQQVSDAQPLDKRAFRMMLDLQERIETVEADNQTLTERFVGLEDENRRYRRVLREVVVRLEKIAAWVRDGHQPPPPYTADDISAYIVDQLPTILDDGDDA